MFKELLLYAGPSQMNPAYCIISVYLFTVHYSIILPPARGWDKSVIPPLPGCFGFVCSLCLYIETQNSTAMHKNILKQFKSKFEYIGKFSVCTPLIQHPAMFILHLQSQPFLYKSSSTNGRILIPLAAIFQFLL
jgi:hypothetical protein